MKLLFTICGRAGSKGLKNKNLKDFLGKPLALYSLSAIDLYLKKNPNIDADIVLSTDSKDLQKIFLDSEIRKVEMIDRSEELSGDVIGKIDVIRDAYLQMEERLSTKYDYVIDLDITSPLRRVEDIENLINKMRETKSELVFSVAESRRNPYFNMIEKKDDKYSIVIETGFTARQEAPEVFDINGSLYIYSPELLKSTKHLLKSNFNIIKMMDTGVLDIDKGEDFMIMEIIGKHLFENLKEFKEIKDNIK